MTKLFLQHLLLWSRRLLLTCIVLLGLLIGAARLLLPGIVDHREDIEALAVDILESPVTIESIESGWVGLRPVITLNGVQMQQTDGHGRLRLDSLNVVLAVIPSLMSGELRAKTILIHMQKLELQRASDGRLSFNLGELAESDEPGRGKEQLEWILRQPDLHLDINAFVFNDQTGKLPVVNLRDVGIDFVNQTDKLIARLKTGASEVAEEVNLTASLDTNHLTPGNYKADVYLRLKAASLSFWQQALARTFELPDSGHTDATAWMKVSAGKITQVSGDLSLDGLSYKQSEQSSAFSIESMAGKFNWQRTDPGWLLQVAKLQIERSGKKWPESALSVEYRREDMNRFLVSSDYFRVQDILPLIDRQPLIHELIGDDLQLLSPAGEINDLKLQASIDQQEQLIDYALQTQVSDFSVNAHGGWPGVKGLDGYLVATEQAGLLKLSTTNALLDLNSIFRDPLHLDTLKGDISWTRLTSGLLIESQQLDADNSHLSTQSRLSIHLPAEGSAFVDVQTNFKDGDGAYTSFYLPKSVLGEETLAWLDKSIVAGYVEYGSFILHGAVDNFPFDNNDGRFEVRFKVRDGIIDYYKDWPRIDVVEAEVAFVGRTMRIEASSGKIFDADLRDTIVTIDDLESDNPLLQINGHAQTSSKDLFRYLNETGLAGDFQTALSVMTLSGTNDLKLSIDVPLSKGDASVKGQLTFHDNQLNIESWGLQLDKINGVLDFTGQSFSAADITAIFDQREVNVNVDTVQTQDGPEARISARSRADLSQLIEPKNKELASQFSGESPFEVLINIPDTKPGQLIINSSLVGTEVKFPYPLDKQADDTLEFSLQTGLSGKSEDQIRLTLGERLRASFAVDADTHKLATAYVQFGADGKADQLANQEGLILGGRLDYLDIDAWKTWYRELDLPEGGTDLSLAFKTDLMIDRLAYARWFVDDFMIKASSEDKIWKAEIFGAGVEGLITYNDAGTDPVLDINLQHLAILKRSDEKQGQGQEQVPEAKLISTLKPSDLPAVNLDIQKLSFDERDLGRLTIKASPGETRYQLKKINLKTDETVLAMAGHWLQETESSDDPGQHETHLTVDIESSNFGQFMERLGYVNTVKGGEASLLADFSAEVSPMNIEISQISGDVHLSILDGEVVEIDPGSAGRIFGLLSFQTLPRRLSLDFTDLFNKGMSFNEINGTFTVSQGQAYTNNLTMDAPSSQVEVSGRIGLTDEDYDQHVRVIPNLSSTLPIAGALAGGPGLAIVMLITHHLLQEPIDKLTQFEYQVSGPWKSPEIVSVKSGKEEVTGASMQNIEDSTNFDDSL